MKVDEVSINQVFLANRTLKIPYFQRPYVWKEENWAKFYEDIADIAIAVTQGEEPETYFMGSIILKKGKFSGGQQLDVIDGQQRLTTIVLFMKALFLSLGRNDFFTQNFMQQSLLGESKPILIPNHNDTAIYHQLISADVLRSDSINKESAMANAFAYFASRIIKSRDGSDEDYSITPSDLYNTIVNYVRLVCIQVEKDENAQKIFETINCTGIKLTTGEMLKNYLYDETRVDDYERTWMRVFEGKNMSYWNDDIVLGRLESNHIQNFFYRYMLIKMQEPDIKRNLSTSEIKSYRKQDGLFEKFKSLIEKNNLSIDTMIEDVVACAKLYMETFKKDTLEDALTKYTGIERLVWLMYAQDSWTMTPYILYVLKNQPDARERQKIFGYMETYLVRRTFCKSKNNNYSDLFSENLIGQEVNTFDKFKAYVNDINSRGALLIPSDAEMINAIMNGDQKRSVTILLYMLESKLNDGFTDSDYINDYSSFVAEQVMPEKNNSTWGSPTYSDEDRERLTKTIGNYVLLRGKLKTADKTAAWPRKRDAMKERATSVVTSAVVERGLATWTEEIIERRNQWFAEKAIEAWPL
ncbi:MAG: DUF262 domain-containing HNH endonuclease family protein [Bacteroidales bacterium]|nr:DUF262 domain-containing HNH endonuclease family protein [Bacteroidales bacterium]